VVEGQDAGRSRNADCSTLCREGRSAYGLSTDTDTSSLLSRSTKRSAMA
jgi:hypothetical protein